MKKQKKPILSSEDKALFQKSVAGTQRLYSDKALLSHPRPNPVRRHHDDREQDAHLDEMSDYFNIADVDTNEEIVFSQPGVSPSQIRKLRRGQITATGQLDLHGMNVEQARVTLATYIHHCHTQGIRCIRVIHGKGHGSRGKTPILKNRVNRWLRQKKEVLAFCSALPRDGGTGALYILFKRP